MIREPLECFTDQQLLAYKKEFERCDGDRDGSLTRSEFESALRHLGIPPLVTDLAEMYKDLNPEGGRGDEISINLVNFIRLIYYYVRAADTTDDLICAFAVFDQNRDGTVSVNDAKYILTHLRIPVPHHHVDDMLGRLQKENRINYAEMIRYMRPR
jgi:Ca2+-binding EF-hand superfamily protein